MPRGKTKTAPTEKKLTPQQLATRWGVGLKKVHAFISSVELRAINIANLDANMPRYLIDPLDVQRFEQSREVVPSAPLTPAQQRRLERKHPNASASQQPRLSRKPSSPPAEFFE